MRIKMLTILCSLLLVFCPGCQRNDEEVTEKNNLTQEQQEVDLDILKVEYDGIMALIQDVLFSISDEELNAKSAIELFRKVKNNRIDATQPQTIELNEKLDELLDLGFSYFVNNNEAKREDIRNRMTEVLNEMQELMTEIETLLESCEEV